MSADTNTQHLEDCAPEEILEMYPEELEDAIQRAEADGRKYAAAALRNAREHVREGNHD